MKSERRFWFEVPPFADVINPRDGSRWNVGEHQSVETLVIMTSYDTPARKVLINVNPFDSVDMLLPDIGDAIGALASAGFAMQVINEGAI